MSYERHMKSVRIGAHALQTPDSLLYSSNVSADNNSFTKHNWVICDQSKPKYEFMLSFKDSTALNHISISLTFSQSFTGIRQEGKKEGEIAIKEDAKDPEDKETRVGNLGLFTFRSGGGNGEAKKYHIPLKIVSFKGAQYSFQNSVSRMLLDTNLTYASNYPKPQFVFAHQLDDVYHCCCRYRCFHF